MSIIITLTSERFDQEGLKRGAGIILKGGSVAFPTESFYGLGVNVLDEEAIQRLFKIKGRREDHPILILIPSRKTVEQYVVHVSDLARQLMDRFWPGGLTMVFEARPEISPLLTAETGKIGVRLSSHPIATGLARITGVAITGTSANVTGHPACRSAHEVMEALGDDVDLILDGGYTPGGKGSTILDVTVSPPKILREGLVGRNILEPFFN